MSHTHITNVLSGSRSVTFDFCASLAQTLGEPPEKIFRLAGLLPPLPAADDPTIEEISQLVRNISPESRQEILNYLRFRYQQDQDKKSRK